MRRIILLTGIVIVLFLENSCQKGPGIGGEASITGKITGITYDKKTFTYILDSGAVGNLKVNIIYGDDIQVDASQNSSYDGSYDFQYLRDGNYTIFVYSRSHKTDLYDSAVVVKATLTGKKQVLNLPVIRVYR